MLHNDSEGIVRKEALSTLTKLNSLRRITNRHRDKFYSMLVYGVVNDLHWEVKVEALKAWASEIRNMLSDEGMIDGIFPPVTFSKEKRKIVQLNEKEINLRFSKILNELSQRGCLGAILKCLNDDCDVAVIREAKSLVKKLVDKLDEYNYTCASDSKNFIVNQNSQTTSDNNLATTSVLTLNNYSSKKNDSSLNSPLPATIKLENNSVEIVSGDVETIEFLNSEEIIESILDTKDINLLAEAYEQNMHINGEDKQAAPSQHEASDELKHVNEFYYRQFSNVSAKEFLAIVRRTDFEEEIYKQEEWFLYNENLVSLLEDILSLFELESNIEKISADCY